MEGKDLKWIYETVLIGPGMDETVKLTFSASRKLILLLVEVLEKGSSIKGNGLIDSVDKELIKELHLIQEEFLEKAKLSQLHTHLKSIN